MGENAVNIGQHYENSHEAKIQIMKIMLTDIHGIIIIMSGKLRVFPIFRSNYENNLDRNIDPREKPKFSRHYDIISSFLL